jgi:hypothetical protein
MRIHLAALAVVCLALPARADAQTVLLNVVNGETSVPVFGALAHLLGADGQVVKSVLTDSRGRALFVSIPAARYRARIEMIGMATLETDPFDVSEVGAAPREVRLEPRAIDLEAIDVRAERRRCTARPSDEGMAVALLWEEARKALAAAALTTQQGLYRYETMMYERDVEPRSNVVIRDEESRREGYMRTPFARSLPPEELTSQGFVRDDGREIVYYAPDAEVLLSDAFLDTHCFRLAEESDRPDVVGLEFEPLEGRGGVADIGGTMWLDRETAELRWLDYTYYNLDLPVRSAGARGMLEFQRMPSGTWIVPDWWIEMPIIDTRMQLGGSRPVLSRMRRSGGRVLQIHEAGGRSLGGRNPTGGVEGVVVDSAGAPIQGVRVGAVGWNQEAFTDAQGAFGLLGMREGTYEMRFIDPRFEALGLRPTLMTREVIPGEVSYLEFHMPSVGDLLREACRESPNAAEGASLRGRVVDRNGQPLAGAAVRVTWLDELQSVGPTDPRYLLLQNRSGFETATGENGTYTLCGVPREVRMEVMSFLETEGEVAGELTIRPGEAGALYEIRRNDRPR